MKYSYKIHEDKHPNPTPYTSIKLSQRLHTYPISIKP